MLGGTIVLTLVILALMRADQRKSQALYEDMIRRKRARRERAAAGEASTAGPA